MRPGNEEIADGHVEIVGKIEARGGVDFIDENDHAIVDGEYDDLPEAAFYMVGGIEEAVEKAQKMAAEAA